MVVSDERYIRLPIEKIRKADWNYKTENPELSEKLKANIARNGQVENIIVRELEGGFFEVVNGNHRLDCLLDLGYETVFVFNLGAVSLNEAKRIAVETNETKFKAEPEALGAIIDELLSDFELEELSDTMPFTPAELSELTGIDPGAILDEEQEEEPPDRNNQSGIFVIPLGTDDKAREAFEIFQDVKEAYGWENAETIINLLSEHVK